MNNRFGASIFSDLVKNRRYDIFDTSDEKLEREEILLRLLFLTREIKKGNESILFFLGAKTNTINDLIYYMNKWKKLDPPGNKK